MRESMLTFISGGVRSGKSALAETLACQNQQRKGGNLYYLATAAPADGEMGARIRHHQQTRGPHWITLEEPIQLTRALQQVEPNSTLLLDCLTLWSSQVMFSSSLNEAQGLSLLDDFVQQSERMQVDLLLVSNDLNEELPPTDSQVRAWLIFQQLIHQRMVQRADRAIQMLAGIALEWKPSSPKRESDPCN
ncbi:bifunctional adenosylcobinamide kinase/adenosylcobinamide-phosphate guanylyltransferase [Nitrincola alkalilacustris]|uniref:bifunctional adenosylcobinamide kinase/adenosylcobinamide-phosphate guanylyltransferase n=1 Tax=Nitrincola alkalilacustris TaxID=1571224 RepID=UPI001F0F40A0|nr:bifunctional adenosylcobinamide kinase/adenosylcobinamide-phosphate guanylyltransferase [Nitrincola alkalilacustris]